MAVKLFRDPVYDYIAIEDEHRWILDLINTPEMQRLRFISQLGLCNYTYPGATHSRFSHCLGVFHLMQQTIAHLAQQDKQFFGDQEEKDALLSAALLHDIGHSPLSHATEDIFGEHEDRGIQIIQNPSSGINKILKKRSKGLVKKVAGLISKKIIDTTPLWKKSLISSQLDMDRLDYLRRDALYSGAEYGNFDWYRIIHTLELREKKERQNKNLFVVWPEKTKYAIEEYLFSRFYMYQSVYFHHTTRQFECLVRSILRRAKKLAQASKKFQKSLLPTIRPFLEKDLTYDLTCFQRLTDYSLLCKLSHFLGG